MLGMARQARQARQPIPGPALLGFVTAFDSTEPAEPGFSLWSSAVTSKVPSNTTSVLRSSLLRCPHCGLVVVGSTNRR